MINVLVDRISPEAVKAWRLEGEAGARKQTRATISYMVRRRIAGASWRAIASHVNDRVWIIGGTVPEQHGDGPRAGFGRSFTCGGLDEDYDHFDDPYSRFAGAGNWHGPQFDAQRL